MNLTRTAVILAAGVGSRLREKTHDKPKALVEVSGKTILGRAVEALSSHGVRKIVIATGYREEALHRALEGSPIEIVYRRNPRYETTQNAVSLALCRDALDGSSFFKLDGDVLFDGAILERLDASSGLLSVAVDRGVALDPEAMKVKVGSDGYIAAFGKGILVDDASGESIGLERVSAEASTPLFDALDAANRAGETDLYYEDVYSRLIEKGLVASMVDVAGDRWCEVDDMEDLARAERLFP
jgi:choline kinase